MFSFTNGKVTYNEDGSFDYDYKNYSSAEEANRRLKGGLVVCERLVDDKDGRLRLHKIYARSVNERGNGWLDLFTYIRESVKLQKGFYLCRIAEIKYDKNGYVNMVVETVIYLSESITSVPKDKVVQRVRDICGMDEKEDKPVWQFMWREMSPIAFAPSRDFFGQFNQENAYEHGFTGRIVMERLLNGDLVVLDEVSALLLEPTKAESAREYVWKNQHMEKFAENYPLIAKKIQGKDWEDLLWFIKKNMMDFDSKGLEAIFPEGASAEEISLCKVEAALQYWKALHKSQKDAKKAAKKGQKANPNT